MIKKFLNFEAFMYLFLSFFLAYNVFYSHAKNSFALYWLPLLIIVFFVLIKYIIQYLSTLKLKNDQKFNYKEFIIYGIILLISSIVSIFWNNPAAITDDSIKCYEQALTNTYSDWHPVFYTLIFYKLPMLIYENYLSCSIFQCIFISLILLYFCKFCRTYFLNKKSTILLLTFIVFNPIFLKYASGLIKDIPFSFCIFLGTIILIENFITEGEYLKSNLHKLIFILMCFGVTFFRHNGIVNILLMTLFLIIFYKENRKFLLIFLTSFLLIKILVTGPIYSSLQISSSGGIGEMLGVPLNQMSYIYNNSGKVTENNIKTMEKIADIDAWEKLYHPTSFNNIKVSGTYDREYCSKNYQTILVNWFEMVINNPYLALESYIHVSSAIWQLNTPNGEINSINFTFGPPNDITIFDKLMNNYIVINSDSILRLFFIDVGEGLFLMLLSLTILIKNKKINIKAFIPYILVLSNILVIALLITGREVRFIYSSILCSYPLILFAFRENPDENA